VVSCLISISSFPGINLFPYHDGLCLSLVGLPKVLFLQEDYFDGVTLASFRLQNNIHTSTMPSEILI